MSSGAHSERGAQALSARERRTAEPFEATYRYGVIFLIVLALVMFEIVASAGDGERAIALALTGAALIVAGATWRTRTRSRGQLTLALSTVIVVLVLCVAAGIVSAAFTQAVMALLLLAIPATLIRGLLRLIKQRGVIGQAVAGGLSIYLMLGLLFASLIGFVAEVASRPYFVQGAGVSNGDRVYYSFTVLTTTGFGDYSAAVPVGHALAVLEMLTGQLYLVTVIGVLIGHYVGRRT